MSGGPQLEDGYLRIANELYDAIVRYPLGKQELKVVLSVIRKTYGYGKKEDELSASQIARMTGIHRAHVSKAISRLITAQVLLKRHGRHGNALSINKNYQQWGVPKQHSAETAQGVCRNGSTGAAETAAEVLPKRHTQKTTPKDNSKRHAPCSPPMVDEELWADWVNHRREKRATLTPTAIRNQTKLLSRVVEQGGDPNAVIRASLESGWTGLFERNGFPEQARGGNGQSNLTLQDIDEWAKRFAVPEAERDAGE